MSEYLTDKRKVYSLDLLSGYSCPFAGACFSRLLYSQTVNAKYKTDTKRIRCFSFSGSTYNGVYNLRKHNFDSCELSTGEMVDLINKSLPPMPVSSIHVAGDFFNLDYMRAWYSAVQIQMRCSTLIPSRSDTGIINEMPTLHNFVLTASYGGRDDWRIGKYDIDSLKWYTVDKRLTTSALLSTTTITRSEGKSTQSIIRIDATQYNQGWQTADA